MADPEDTDLVNGTGPPPPVPPAPSYSTFLPWQKRCIIAVVAFGGWFSSLSSFIYFPAIPALASDLGVGVERINLTVTSYLIMSGIFPALVGNAADKLGRRPVFLFTLVVYVAANIGLALQNSFGLLFFLRMLQSAGISGTYSVTYGVIGDLFTPAERGGYSGIISFFLNTPPSIGPVISGLLLLRWDWRAIFWFLSIVSPCCLLSMALLLPETSRAIVGDGSIHPKGMVYRAVIPILAPPPPSNTRPSNNEEEQRPLPDTKPKKPTSVIPNPLACLLLLRHRRTAIVVGCFGAHYTIYSCLQASLSTLFTEIYHVPGLVSGLTYLPFGVACAISAFGTGRILDWDYRHTAAKEGAPVDRKRGDDDLGQFPIEHARLRSVKFSVALCSFFIVGYGWSLQQRTHMAVPLVLQFFIGLTEQGIFTGLSTLLVDMHPEASATAQAANNFIRCETAAAGLALLDLMLRRMGAGWTFVLFAGLGWAVAAMLWVLDVQGLGWRQTARTGARP
ncbi:major facilitator superfamily transporter [Apiospora rasikravindrae]|uniref:Major facilitator superfamily transporter n=1 Tax=Apiospora rasikravindrae TaxID=990691 RepID=A0ABR1T7G8_9PEZI